MEQVKKSKRIKRVFSTPGPVLHMWANQTQSDARSRNVFFEGRSCYSYGRHYELGRLVKYKGATVALINATGYSVTGYSVTGYSVTTSGHINAATSAASHLTPIRVKGDAATMWNVPRGLKAKATELRADMEAHFKRRVFYSGDAWAESYLRKSIQEFNTLCAKLKSKNHAVKVPPGYPAKYDAHVKAKRARTADLKTIYNSPEAIAKRGAKAEAVRLAYAAEYARRAIERDEARALDALKAPEEIAAWRAGQAALEAAQRSFKTTYDGIVNAIKTNISKMSNYLG